MVGVTTNRTPPTPNLAEGCGLAKSRGVSLAGSDAGYPARGRKGEEEEEEEAHWQVHVATCVCDTVLYHYATSTQMRLQQNSLAFIALTD